MTNGNLGHAARFQQSAEQHEQSARAHDYAAALCAKHGDEELAALERRVAGLERAAAELERDRARLFEQRGGRTSAGNDADAALTRASA